MNKKVLKVAFVSAIVLVSGINVFNAQKSDTLSDIALANVEALANTEQDPCLNAMHCKKMESFKCWYYNITADENMMISYYDNHIHVGADL